jgi:hypothetical protein
MEFDLVYEDLETFFPFQNMHVEDVHTAQTSSVQFVCQEHYECPNYYDRHHALLMQCVESVTDMRVLLHTSLICDKL